MKTTHILCLLLPIIISYPAISVAQIGMGGTPHPSAVLDIQSPANNRGMLMPRLTTAQRKAIADPPIGSLVFDIEKGRLFMNDGQDWLPISATSNDALLPTNRTAGNGAEGDFFGNSVAISGDYAIVGAFYKSARNATHRGAAYVFSRTPVANMSVGWAEQQELVASDAAAEDQFGYSIALSGDYAIVGAYFKTINGNAGQGAAYIFARNITTNTWTQQARLTASDGAASDVFGYKVAIVGDVAMVSARGKKVGNNAQQGAVYVFTRTGTTWAQQQKLVASDGAANDSFGSSLDISGNYAIIGAYGKDIVVLENGLLTTHTDQGAAYIFKQTGTPATWSQQQRISASDGAAQNYFGVSASIAGNYAVVGVLSKNTGFGTKGAAYVFKQGVDSSQPTSWGEQTVLSSYYANANDYFGISVSFSGDYILVGSSQLTVNGNANQGGAYLYKRDPGNEGAWPLDRLITDLSPAGTGNGGAVNINNGTYIIGGIGFQNAKGKVAFGTVD